MSDEALLVVALLGGIAALSYGLWRRQQVKEARLTARTEIEIPIQSLYRSALVIALASSVGPVAAGVFATLTDPWARSHALAMTMTGIGLGVVGMLAGLRAASRYCRVGLIRYTPSRLELQLGDGRWSTDLEQPYELEEGLAHGPAEMPVQVLYVKQGNNRWGFSYGLPLRRRPHGENVFDRYVAPLVNGEARVIHDRLRQRLGQ